jgi:FkbM family methyltransferase
MKVSALAVTGCAILIGDDCAHINCLLDTINAFPPVVPYRVVAGAFTFNPRRALNTLFGRDFYLWTDTRVVKERFGSDYGGWEIALEGVTKQSVVYSFGVGEDASFDTALIERFGLVVHAFDPTPRAIEWVRREKLPENFVFHDYGLADFDGHAQFNPPENPEHVSHTILARNRAKDGAIEVSVKRLKTTMEELGHQRIDILKMDIEGAEYQVLDDIVKSETWPIQILVEFHHRFENVGFKKTKKAVATLQRCGYRLFSVSDSLEDFCFVR